MTKQSSNPNSNQLDGNMSDAQAMSALKQHGPKIFWAIVVALASYFGWQYYQNNHAKIDTVAADSFADISERNDALILGLNNPDLDEAAQNQLKKEQDNLFADIDKLVASHGKSAYAWQALIIKAHIASDTKDYKTAITALQQALNIDLKDDGLKAITSLRLAQVMLADGDKEGALAIVNEKMPPAFEASKQELLGDIYVAKDDVENAKKAYETAWNVLAERQEVRSLLSVKMQSLGMNPKPITQKPLVVAEAKPQISDGENKKADDTANNQTSDTSATQ